MGVEVTLADLPLAFIDVETTGLTPSLHEIIDIAIIRRDRDGRRVFATKVRPERIEDASPRALEVNGYHPGLWANAPFFHEIADDVLAWLDGTVVVGHNVTYDVAMVEGRLIASGKPPKWRIRRVDTCTLAYEWLSPLGLRSLGLEAIRDLLGWDPAGAHTALTDATDCERLFDLLNRTTAAKVKRAVRRGISREIL